MKQLIFILRNAVYTTKNDRALRRTILFVWLLYAAYYGARMFTPIVQSALLDGAAGLFDDTPSYGILLLGVCGIVMCEGLVMLYNARWTPLHLRASGEISQRIQAGIYDKLCRICYSTFNSPKLYENIKLGLV